MPRMPLGEPGRVLSGWLLDEAEHAVRALYRITADANRRAVQPRDQAEHTADQIAGRTA